MLPFGKKEGARMLVRQSPPSFVEWLKLIEFRRSLIVPHMRDMPLMPLSKLRMMPHSNRYWTLDQYKPKVMGGHDLDVKAIWPLYEGLGSPRSNYPATQVNFRYPPSGMGAIGGTERFWGLSRDGNWLVVETDVDFNKWESGPAEFDVKSVKILKSPLPELFAFAPTTPRKVWETLGKAVKAWYDHREALLHDAQSLTAMVEFEESLLGLVSD